MKSVDNQFDVAILGTGIGGTILGAILARQGLRVLLLEQGTHPRFAIGESTIPETTIMLLLMANRYGVPEIGHLANFNDVRTQVSSACGVKRNFSFLYHRDGQPHRPEESTQMSTLVPPMGPDVHYFRQDVDAHMFAVAVSYGAEARQQTTIQEIDFEATNVRLRSTTGETFWARYVVDAGGMRAPLAQKFGLREQPCPLKTQSRSLFTHMVGVKPYDRCGASRKLHGLPSPLSQGTLHHVFAGGWIWVIPFDNHPTSTNPLCSVGLTLDLTASPKPACSPEDEFWEVVSRFPSVRKQFEGARSVRPWTATDRLQYSAHRTVGDRFCLLPHAASFVDPLFSSGLTITMAAVNLIAARLIRAHTDDDFSAKRFEYVDTWVRKGFAYYDRLVSCSYVAFRDFELWNAWHRVWMLSGHYGGNGMIRILTRYYQTGDPSWFDSTEACPYRGVQAIDFEPCQAIFLAAAQEVDSVQAGRQTPSAAAAHIYQILAQSGISPTHWKIDQPAQRYPAGTFTLFPMFRLVAWTKYRSPQVVRRHYSLNWGLDSLAPILWRLARLELQRACRGITGLIRDVLFCWNRDWHYPKPGTALGIRIAAPPPFKVATNQVVQDMRITPDPDVTPAPGQ